MTSPNARTAPRFTAGIVTLPFVLILAVTGGIYLFKDEINDAAYSKLRLVQPSQTQMLAPSLITSNALTQHPGILKAYHPPAADSPTAEVKIVGEDGLRNTICVNPYSGAVLGQLWDGGAAGLMLLLSSGSERMANIMLAGFSKS